METHPGQMAFMMKLFEKERKRPKIRSCAWQTREKENRARYDGVAFAPQCLISVSASGVSSLRVKRDLPLVLRGLDE